MISSSALPKLLDSKDGVTKANIEQFNESLQKSANPLGLAINYLDALTSNEFKTAIAIESAGNIQVLISQFAGLIHPDNLEKHNRTLIYFIESLLVPSKELSNSSESQIEAAYYAARALFYLKINFWPSPSCDVLKETNNKDNDLGKIHNNISEALNLYMYMKYGVSLCLNKNTKDDLEECYETYLSRKAGVLKLLDYLIIPGCAEKKAETEDSPFALYALFRKNVILMEKNPREEKYHCAAIATAIRFLFVNRSKSAKKTYVHLLSKDVYLFLKNYIEKNHTVKYLSFALKASNQAAYKKACEVQNTHETTPLDNDCNITNYILYDSKDPVASKIAMGYFELGMKQACGRKMPSLEKFIKRTPTSSNIAFFTDTKSERSPSPGDDKKSIVADEDTPKPANDKPRPKLTPYVSLPPLGGNKNTNSVAASVAKESEKKKASRGKGGKSVELSLLRKL